jgi:hypothetical protein
MEDGLTEIVARTEAFNDPVLVGCVCVCLLCLAFDFTCKGLYWLSHRQKTEGSAGGDGNGDNPYNYDPDDPQDWWKKDGGKAFRN